MWLWCAPSSSSSSSIPLTPLLNSSTFTHLLNHTPLPLIPYLLTILDLNESMMLCLFQIWTCSTQTEPPMATSLAWRLAANNGTTLAANDLVPSSLQYHLCVLLCCAITHIFTIWLVKLKKCCCPRLHGVEFMDLVPIYIFCALLCCADVLLSFSTGCQTILGSIIEDHSLLELYKNYGI